MMACVTGYIWLFYSISRQSTGGPSLEICMIKNATNIPCPSCGSTRSVISITKGSLTEAMMINPIGYIISLVMLIAPIWIVSDLLRRKATLLAFYLKAESFIKTPRFAVPLIILVAINWIWNITKNV
jgi:hypothetical protein